MDGLVVVAAKRLAPLAAEAVAAGILAGRRAGLPSPAEKTSRKPKRIEIPARREMAHVFIRAAGMPPSTSGKDARRHTATKSLALELV